MELRNLITFIHVAELGSFTKAAEQLGYSQSTVSFQIKQLEDRALFLEGKLTGAYGIVWNDDLDKGQAYYCRLKRLFKERDAIVHSKSHLSKYQGMTEVEFKQYVSQNTERADNVGYDEDAFDKDEVDTVIRTALDSLKAIYDIAKLFDAHDSNVHAVSKLIRPNGVRWGEATEKQYKSVVLPALGIKVEKKNEI